MTGCSIAENKSSDEFVRSLTCWYTENLTDVETLRGGV